MEIKVTTKFSRTLIEVKGSNLPAIWFYKDENIMNTPSPVIKSPEQARLFAKMINKAADEWEKVRNDNG